MSFRSNWIILPEDHVAHAVLRRPGWSWNLFKSKIGGVRFLETIFSVVFSRSLCMYGQDPCAE